MGRMSTTFPEQKRTSSCRTLRPARAGRNAI
jgi:hypothetical protein